VQYEDDWVLVTKGVTVPEDADVVKSDAGYVVAFRPVKKPKVVEYVRYAGKSYGNDYYSTSGTYGTNTYKHKIIFVETDGVLTDVRLVKN